MAGRTTWVPKDSGWWRRSKVAAAGMENERAPAVLDWLTCEAKSQSPGEKDEFGWVKAGYAAIALGATFGHATADEVCRVVSSLVAHGLLDEFEEGEHGLFTCRISGWREDVFLPLSATRRAAQRANKAENGSTEPKDSGRQPTTTDDVSPDVPERRPTGQDRTGQSEADASPDDPPANDLNADRPEVHRLCALLAEHMVANDPQAKVAPTSKAWLDAARLLVDVDGREVQEIAHVIRFTQADEFERANVLSMPKLRKRYPNLRQKAQQWQRPGSGPAPFAGQSAAHPADVQAAELRARAAAAREAEAA